LGILEADHAETAPGAANLVITKLVCSLAGQTQPLKIVPGTLAWQAYGKDEAVEAFRCHYGLEPAYRARIFQKGLKVAGVDVNGEVRIVELPDRRFFVATLFLPQLSSSAEQPHPLIIAYLKAAAAFRREREGQG
jgi:CTP synthase (UTP-ammonia lyase)